MNGFILNVDDEDSGRDLVTSVLRREGFEVREARSAQEALRLVRDQPDLVVLDVNLPDLSGFEVARRVKSDPSTASIPILYVSAAAISEQERAAELESWADAYLTHPLEPGLLVAAVKAILRARRAESEVAKAAREWQTTFDAIGHGVCLIDAEGIVRRANSATATLLGKPLAAIIGSCYESVCTAGRPEEGWPFERARASGHREATELKLGERWLLIGADPRFDESGGFTGWVCTIVDITERKQREQERERMVEQLALERARLEAVLNQMPAAVILAEAPSGRLVLGNRKVEEIWRHPFQTADVGEHHAVYKGFHSDGRPYEPEEWPLARAISAGEVVTEEEIEILRGDATRGVVLASASPIRDAEGRVVAGVATFLDITERKQLESLYRQSQKMEAMGRLAGGVAHDFNNLLTIVCGYGQMLLDVVEPGHPLRRDLEAIMEAANRATTLTRQLLTFSRRQIVQPRVLDLNRLVARMNRMLRRVIGEDIELKTLLKAETARIKADPGQIEQVIMNLAVNARDAMPKGGKLIIETAEAQIGPDDGRELGVNLPPGRYVRLSVTDTGRGMDAEVRSHLFEPFFTTKSKGKGTGLGLSTVYGIVRQSGGDIAADSEVGKGTVFRIYFPRVDEPAWSGALNRSRPLRRGAETILLVEDEADVRRLASEMLSRNGYKVIEAADGLEALQAWNEHSDSIDLLLTDVIMPQMSGRELAQKLTAMRPELKVLYMSGYAGDVIARHGVITTDTAFVQKPFTQELLVEKVRRLLDKA